MADYWIARQGNKHGPFPEEQVRNNYASGRVLPTDLVWTDGMADWKAASEVLGAVPTPPAPAAKAAPATPYQPPAAVVRDEGDAGTDLPYAGFWVRFGALVVDNFIVYLVAMLAAAVLGGALAVAGSPQWVVAGGYVAFFVGAFFYFTLMESGERGATLGKRMFRLRVVTADGHERISFGRAVGRYFAHALSNITLYIGYLIQPFNQRKQALHDMVSGTAVVSVAPASTALVVIAIIVGLLIPTAGIVAAISIPAYQDYTVRAKVSEAILAAAPARTAVHAYMMERNTVPSSLEEAGVQVPSTRTVQSVAIDPRNATLTITLAFAPLSGKTILLVPRRAGADNAITWRCRPGTVPRKYLPASCRNS